MTADDSLYEGSEIQLANRQIARMISKQWEFQERIEAVEKKLEQHEKDEYAHRR